MDKVPGSPFQSSPHENPPKSPTPQNVPRPNDAEMTDAATAGIKRKVKEISPEEGGINPAFVQTQLLKQEGNRAEYKKGISYEGEFLEGIPNGQGSIYYKDVRTYVGSLKNGFPHGVGKMTYFDGTSYEGTFKNGYPQGSGVFQLPNGSKLEVVFKDGVARRGSIKIEFRKNGSLYFGPTEKKQGDGTLITKKGEKFKGAILNEVFHGNVKVYKKNQLYFEGQFEKGKPIHGKISGEDYDYTGQVDEYFERVGYGKLLNKKDNSVLQGEFLDDGDFRGDYINAAGVKTNGLFKNSAVPEGPVQITYTSGNVYIGPVANGYPHGYGEFIHIDGTKYRGQFEKGIFVDGIIHFSNGVVYTGTVKNYEMHGFGKFQGNDAVYEGEFSNNVFQGHGKATFPSGGVYEGLWLDGRLFVNFERQTLPRSYEWTTSGTVKTNQYEGVNESKTGKGSIIYPNGSIYKGSIIDGLANGEGELVSPQGDKYNGLFLDGKFSGKGIIQFKNYSYEGDFKVGLYSGKGKETQTNSYEKLIFEGSFKDGLRHGDAIVTFTNGIKVTVQLDENKPVEGERTFFLGENTGIISHEPVTLPLSDNQKLIVFPTGAYLIANTDGIRIISGIFHYPNGDTYEGQFEDANSNPPSFLPQGLGTMTWKGRGVYTGQFKQGNPDIHPDYLTYFKSDQRDFFTPQKIS